MITSGHFFLYMNYKQTLENYFCCSNLAHERDWIILKKKLKSKVETIKNHVATLCNYYSLQLELGATEKVYHIMPSLNFLSSELER